MGMGISLRHKCFGVRYQFMLYNSQINKLNWNLFIQRIKNAAKTKTAAVKKEPEDVKKSREADKNVSSGITWKHVMCAKRFPGACPDDADTQHPGACFIKRYGDLWRYGDFISSWLCWGSRKKNLLIWIQASWSSAGWRRRRWCRTQETSWAI